jgi:hypothetical protein
LSLVPGSAVEEVFGAANVDTLYQIKAIQNISFLLLPSGHEHCSHRQLLRYENE